LQPASSGALILPETTEAIQPVISAMQAMTNSWTTPVLPGAATVSPKKDVAFDTI
jgi:hypothetical protein